MNCPAVYTNILFQVGDEGDTKKSFLIEVEWLGTYPDEAPKINMDIFFNEHMYVLDSSRRVSFLL